MSQERWAKLDVGQYEIKELQCERCIHKLEDPMVCNEFPERKPSQVLKVEVNCPKFKMNN